MSEVGDDEILQLRKENPEMAVVQIIDNKIVLDDPIATAILRSVGKNRCRDTFEINAERIAYFTTRINERNLSSSDVVILIANVNDMYGGELADILMPDHDWQQYRNKGQIPFARGLVDRSFIQDFLAEFDTKASLKLEESTEISVTVVDYGVAEIFPA